jgi:hypothetical protein
MIGRRSRPVGNRTPRGAGLACAVAVVLASAACGGDDSADETDAVEPSAAEPSAAEPAAAEPAGSDDPAGEDSAAEGEPAGDLGGSDGGLGSGTAIVTFDGEEYLFATGDGGYAGQCRDLYGVLVVDLPLVEANGETIPPDTGRLELQVEMQDVPDYEPWANLSVPGARWFAGADEVADISGIETPPMTLTASGNTVTGTQAMVPMVAGVNSAIEATIEVTCD